MATPPHIPKASLSRIRRIMIARIHPARRPVTPRRSLRTRVRPPPAAVHRPGLIVKPRRNPPASSVTIAGANPAVAAGAARIGVVGERAGRAAGGAAATAVAAGGVETEAAEAGAGAGSTAAAVFGAEPLVG